MEWTNKIFKLHGTEKQQKRLQLKKTRDNYFNASKFFFAHISFGIKENKSVNLFVSNLYLICVFKTWIAWIKHELNSCLNINPSGKSPLNI